ncbi:MAG TPA: hypothetical protein VFC62_03515 [Atopostipes sp.]|nr:hypothetical protein [Atopostipes sp.]
MPWDREKALELRNQMTTKEIADELGTTFGAVNSYFYRQDKKDNKVGRTKGKEEQKPRYIDHGDYYIVYSGKREITITKADLRRFKWLYCGRKWTLNQVVREMEIPRNELWVVKTAFSITKDDVPYIDEDIMSNTPQELVKKTIEGQKREYFLELQNEEIKELKKENERYRRVNYFYDRLIEEAVIPIEPLDFEIKKDTQSLNEALLVFADWHLGLKTDNFWNKYNIKIARERLQELVENTIIRLNKHKVRKLHVMSLGDLIHGLIHTTNRIEAEINVVEQIRVAWQLMGQILKELAKEREHVYFYLTYGNHARLTPDKRATIDEENLELLIADFLKARLQRIPNITIKPNEYDNQIIVANICGHKVFGVHGDRDKPEKVTENLSLMLGLKPSAIFTADKHHAKSLEVHGVDVYQSRSLSGVDTYARNIRKTSSSGQSLYIYTPEGMDAIYNFKL